MKEAFFLRLLTLTACILYTSSQNEAVDEDTRNEIDRIFGTGSGSQVVQPTTGPTTIVTEDGDKCICVPYYLCDPATNTTLQNGEYDGIGKLDIRFKEDECQESVEVCCKEPRSPDNPITLVEHPERVSGCGIRNDLGVDFQITTDGVNDAEIFEFPWVAAILNSADGSSVCAGTLIHPQVVMTGAHCLKQRPVELKVRVGEWDTQTVKERLKHEERAVDRYIKHPNFNPKSLVNDVGLIILKSPVPIVDNINTICLPNQDEDFQKHKDCIATGWGKKNFGKAGRYSVILKKVILDMVDQRTCQQQFRRTRLGPRFVLDKTLICAGGVEGIDTCEGDGGAPLVCKTTNDRYKQAGIVAWGIGCGDKDVPGAYGYVSKFRKWIDGEMQKAGFDQSYYTWKP